MHKNLIIGILTCFISMAALSAPLPKLNIDPSQVTVSGLSSGGYMAVQLHVAYSNTFKGVGVVAGGPYYCAENSFFRAIGRCMSKPSEIDVGQLVAITKRWSAEKEIDATTHLKDAKVFIFSGTLDSTVKPGVVDALNSYYGNFVNPKNVTYQNKIPAEHGMVTEQYGAPCSTKASPFLNNCQLDLSGVMLKHLYGGLKERNNKPLAPENFIEFDQGEFVSGHGMASSGWAYIPQSCRGGKSACKLHVALHGCQQNVSDVKLEFVQNAGYNRWADANNLVVLYPQTGKGSTNSCWDWWGYESSNYAKKSGPQMMGIKAMVDGISSAGR
jgi:predicted peptidase